MISVVDLDSFADEGESKQELISAVINMKENRDGVSIKKVIKFFTQESLPNSETTKMSLGECYNRIKDNELKVPDYQRGYVWSKRQQQGYLESLAQNLPLFGPVINIETDTGDQWIMDGQNRIMTIYKFMNDEITFTDETDETIRYSELPDSEKRKVKNTKISYTETRDWTKSQCQEFFTTIQEGVKLKDGELIHAKPDNPLTREIAHIYSYFGSMFTDKAVSGGLGLSKSMIHRYGHYEIIGTIMHMIRTSEYPVRPGKTALKEFNIWSDPHTPTPSQRDTCVIETKECLHKYSQIIHNVARLKEGVKKEEHLRLMYFIYKSMIFREVMTDEIYSKIDNLLNRVLNKNNPEYNQIVLWGTGGVENIYDLYCEIYNS